MNLSFILVAVAIWAAYVRNLAKLTRPVLWKQLLYAFPSTMFLVNLGIYYVIWWYLRLTTPTETTARDINRMPIFDEFELGSYDIRYTIVITLIVIILVIGAARLMDRSSRSDA